MSFVHRLLAVVKKMLVASNADVTIGVFVPCCYSMTHSVFTNLQTSWYVHYNITEYTETVLADTL